MYVCMYVSTCIHICVHIYIYTHIDIKGMLRRVFLSRAESARACADFELLWHLCVARVASSRIAYRFAFTSKVSRSSSHDVTFGSTPPFQHLR